MITKNINTPLFYVLENTKLKRSAGQLLPITQIQKPIKTILNKEKEKMKFTVEMSQQKFITKHINKGVMENDADF